ncbi:hypothetical protein FB446DRAFT_849586 [Lentinula raphanica]|nr:hypothetical protein FB446DRAFT_849586 [Lentinula raphanica]
MKSIYTRFKGKVSRRRGGRNSLAIAESGGTGTGNGDAKPPTRSIGWDLSEQVLSTLTTAAQFAPVPYLSSLSAVALSIFRAVQGAKDNQEGLGELAKTACDLALSVLNTYNELHPSNSGSTTSQDQSSFSSEPALNSHVKQLVETFTNVNDWITEKKSRKIVSKLVSYKSDLREIQKFQKQLRTAMDKFQLQSSITLRTNASQTEKNNVIRHEQTQERLIIIHEEMQVLIRRNSPISSDPTSPISSSSESNSPPHANISSACSAAVVESETPDVFGDAAMNPNELLAASLDSQPGFVERNVSPSNAGFIQENVNLVRFGSVIQGNLPDHNIGGNPQDAVNSYVDNLIKEHLGYVIHISSTASRTLFEIHIKNSSSPIWTTGYTSTPTTCHIPTSPLTGMPPQEEG